MLYISIFSNKFDLNHAIRVSHTLTPGACTIKRSFVSVVSYLERSLMKNTEAKALTVSMSSSPKMSVVDSPLLGQCYKTFSVCDLQIFILSDSVSLTKLEKLTYDKHSSLLQNSVIYGQKSFITLVPGQNRSQFASH
jgi:hypothetical protein